MNEFMRVLLHLPPQGSNLAAEVDYLHYFVITVTMGGAIFVSGLAGYYIIRYRQSAHRESDRAPFHDRWHTQGGTPLWLELVIIAGLLSLFLTWWVIGFRQYVDLRAAPPNSVEIYVVAKKWMWSFAYPQGGGSNAVLYVPAKRPVKLIMISRDVIHSFYVPQFRIKQDVLPGRTTTVWFEANEPGVYPILCAEYCGAGHSTMRGQVVALSEEDYQQRIDAQPRLELEGPQYVQPAVVGRSPNVSLTLVEMGERAATVHGCFRCHTVDGTPHIGPTWEGVYGETIRMEDGEEIVVDEAYLTESMMDPLSKVRAGFPPLMPPYQGLLTAPEAAAIVEYIRSLRDIEGRYSPLALPPASVELPTQGAEPEGTEPLVEEPVTPLSPSEELAPRPEGPPFSPPGTQENVPGQELQEEQR